MFLLGIAVVEMVNDVQIIMIGYIFQSWQIKQPGSISNLYDPLVILIFKSRLIFIRDNRSVQIGGEDIMGEHFSSCRFDPLVVIGSGEQRESVFFRNG